MIRFFPNLSKTILIAGILLSGFTAVKAQPTSISNNGFESSTSAVTNWTTTNHSGTSGISTAEARSGGNAYSNSYSSTTSTGYVQSNSTVSVPNNQYLILMAYYKVSSRASNSAATIGISGNMGSAFSFATTGTYYLASRAIQNTTGSTVSWNPRINMYSTSGTQSRTFYWDDVIAYVSSTSTIDITDPNQATAARISTTTGAAVLNWTNGADNSGGSGVQRTLILRAAASCTASAPTLNDQAVYSKSGGYGVSTIGSWTVLDTVNSSTTTYTDNTISSGTSYIYAIVHEDKAYNHSTPTLVYINASATPTSPTNAQTGVAKTGLNLSWSAICSASSYNLYMSTSQADVTNLSPSALLASNLTSTSYAVSGTLTENTTYYWSLVPKDASGNIFVSAPVWRFTVVAPALSFEITRNTDISYSSILASGNNFGWGSYYNADDNMTDALDLTALGFTGFSYQGSAITSLKANTNGFITFNTSSSANYANSFSTQTQIIAPFWEDLVCQGYISGSAQSTQLSQLQNTLKYLVTGEQGNQVLTIEWSEMEIFSNPGPSINFQVKLYEQDDHIEFVYGKMYGFNGTENYTYSYSVGLSGATVASTPTAGQLVALQLANVKNFGYNNTTDLSELPDCYSSLSFVPNSSPNAANESARTLTNDECANAIVLPIQAGVQNDFCQVFTSKNATASSGIPVCSASTPGTADDDVWFKFTVTTAGNYGVTVNGSGSYNPVVQLFSGNCASLTAISCANATSAGLIETVTANGLVEGTYFVRVYDAGTGAGGSGNFVISAYSIETALTNDECTGATSLTIGTPFASGSTANATASTGVSTSCTGTADDDVWYKFTATSTITKIAVDGGTAYNAVLQYFSGSCSALTSLGCISSTGAAGEESVEFATTIGTQYFVRVYHSTSGATPTTGFTITVSAPVPSCPTLSSPANGNVAISRTSSQTFSWSASASPSVGTKTYTIQISTTPTFSTTLTLSGATGITTTSYTLAANTLTANTQYYWRVLAVNSNGTSAGCSYNAFATNGGTVPSCASGLTPANESSNQTLSTTLSWTAGSGSPTSYDVYLSTSQSNVTSLATAARVATGVTSRSYTPTIAYGTTYYWTVVPKNGSGSASACFVSSFTTIPNPPANDDCAGAVTLSTASTTPITGTTLNATQSMAGTVGYADDDVWYKFTAVSTAHNILVSPVYSFNAVVELFSGSCGSLTSLQTINEKGNGEVESLSATGLTIGQTYYLRVYDFGNTSPSSLTFSISVNDIDLGVYSFVSPSSNNCGNTTVTVSVKNFSTSSIDFATHPVTVSGSVVSPANVTTTFSNAVINTGTLAAGATTNVTLTSTYNVANAGYYTYTATATVDNDNNSNNNSKTSRLQLISLPAPYILSGTGSYCAGGTGVTFTMSGSETGVNYQLFRSSTAASSSLSGTGSAIVFNNVTVDGSYRVVATNSTTNCQSYMSASAVVTVNPLWLGYSSSWNDAANWCGNTVPATNANIIISGSATFMPALPGNVTVNNLELTETNKRVDLNGNTLTVNGAISGSGVIRGSTTSSLTISGSGNMGAIPMDQTTNGSTNALRNLTINIGTGASSDSVRLSAALKLNGTLTLTNGTLSTNGNLTLVSNASGTARVAAIASTANITGNVVSQRYVPSVVRRYRMISPNTSSFTYADVKDNIYVTGTGGATNGFDASTPNSASIYTYQESTTGGRGWKAVTNINQTLTAAKGAIVFVRGDRTLASPAWYTPPYVTQNAVTLDFNGPINKGNISPVLTYTNTGNTTDDGFNLIGNPYPSQIDWTLVTKSNLTPFVYILNPATNGYVANDGTTPIASGQAFFVQANAASPSVTFTESCKTSTSGSSLFKMNVAPFTINMILDSVNSDLAILKFNPAASDSFNINEDALKFTNSSINMGFALGDKQVQINTIPALSAVADTFTLFTNAASNNYRLEFSNFDEIPLSKGVFLRDLSNNTLMNLRQNNVYNFSTASAAGGQGNRFQLIITSQMGALPVEFVEVKATLASNQNDAKVTWVTASELNNEKFVVERSFDNKTFEAIANIKGAGNTKVTSNYMFTDLAAAKVAQSNGVNKIYYRIRQVDFSGASKTSNIAVVNLNAATDMQAGLAMYPNPTKTKTEISVNETETLGNVVVYDITGKIVMQLYETSHKLVLDVTTLNRGIYFVKSGEHQAQKLIVE